MSPEEEIEHFYIKMVLHPPFLKSNTGSTTYYTDWINDKQIAYN